MRYSSDRGGISDRPNSISSMEDAPRTGYCTAACHRGTSAANPARWTNYTSAGLNLNCNSCHADSSGISGAEAPLSGDHVNHITRIGGGNGACHTCHPDNTNDLWSNGRADDGTEKAYPHASDGTEVSDANVSNAKGNLGVTPASLNAFTFDSGTSTCTSSCHSSSPASWSRTSNSAPTFTGTPSITGSATFGSNLTLANTGTTDADGDTVTLHYQWAASGTNIGTDANNYTLTSSEIGKTITCTITASDIYGGSTPATTAATAAVSTGTLTISGSIAASNKTYDGTSAATLSSNTLALVGVQPGDVGNVNLGNQCGDIPGCERG